MRKVIFLPIVIGLLSLTFLTSCEGKKHVTIPEMVDDVITYEGMKAILDKHGLEVPPIYKTTQGADIRVIVIQFDINKLSVGETYDEVRVTTTLYERGSNSIYDTENVKFITGVPQNISREASAEEMLKTAGNFTAAANELTKALSNLSGEFTIDWSKKESYTKLYQTTAFNTRPPASVVWTFTPFKDEELQAGTYYAFALVDVRNPSQEFQIQADTSCIYKAPILFGLFKMKWKCDPYHWEHNLVPANQDVTVLPAETEPPLPVTELPLPVTEQPQLTIEPEPPLPSEEIVLVYGGWPEIREAVLDAVDWSSLISDRNVSLIFKDLEGGQIDVSSRGQDLARCQQFLVGTLTYYPNLHIMVLPDSEALIQFAEELGTYLAGCGFRTSIEIVYDSTVAYPQLSALSAAGEAGLLLSLQVEE